MLFELINPSDAYTLESTNFEAAAIATLLLGQGAYGLKQIDGDLSLPMLFMAGAGAVESWCQDTFGASLEACLARNKSETADVLDSLVIGNASRRREYFETLELIQPEHLERWKAAWHDKRRTSMNDIGARAQALVKAIRRHVAESQVPA